MGRSATRTVLVGDVHGCLDELRGLLDDLDFDAGRDALVSVGDLVGKGPAGAEVVRWFREGGHRAVRGNHEDKILGWRSGERERPLSGSHLAHAQALCDADWRWLEALPLWLRLPEHGVCVMHAGRLPDRPLEDHEPWVLMNVRALRPDGSPSRRHEDGTPWARSWQGPEEIVFGHDAILGLQRWPFATGLDTGCVYGGALSAYVLPERRVVSHAAHRRYVEPG